MRPCTPCAADTCRRHTRQETPRCFSRRCLTSAFVLILLPFYGSAAIIAAWWL